MKFLHPSQRPYPPLVVGAVSDWETWLSVSEPGADPECDIVELRVDALPSTITTAQLLERRCVKPLLITLRHASEGGCRPNWEETDRIEFARQLLPMADLLDWEIARIQEAKSLLSEARKRGITLIGSSHDFIDTPAVSTMLALEDKARAQRMDIAKFAFRLNAASDMSVGCELLEDARGPMALMGMGELGPTSRLLFSQLGSCLIYGYLGSKPSAPGQWKAGDFRRALGTLVPSPA